MKNIIYGIMDLLTIGFYIWLIGYIFINFSKMNWNAPSVVMLIAMVWSTFRFVRMHWYIFKTSDNAKKSVRKIINR